MADTKKIADKVERKKVKRAARKKAAPKAKRTTPRGSTQEESEEDGPRPEQAVRAAPGFQPPGPSPTSQDPGIRI